MSSSLNPFSLIKSLSVNSTLTSSPTDEYHSHNNPRSFSEDLFMMAQFTVDNAADAILWIESNGQLLYVNKAACHIMECTKSELLSMTIYDMDPNYPPPNWSSLWKDIIRKRSMQFESCLKTLSGRIIPTDVALDYMNYKGKEYICASIRDITFRKLSDQKLSKLSDLLRNVVHSIPGSLSVIDKYYNVVYTNLPSFKDATNMTHRNMKCYSNCAYIQNNSDDCVAKEVFRTKEPIIGRQIKLRNNKWAELNCIPLMNEDNEVDMVVEFVPDITPQKKVEETLRESEERWQLALKGNNDGIWDWNIKTNEVFLSYRWKEMLGYEDGEIEDNFQSFTKFIHPDEIGLVMKALNDHTNKKTSHYYIEHRMLCKDGSYKWIMARAQAIWDDYGHPIRVIGSNTDITERKKAEEEIKYLSFHDKLTGLYNRAFFEEELKRLDTKRQLPLSIIIGDVNGLKLSNDVFGHAAGDSILIKIADILKSVCRKEDILCRWGGDEYAVILSRTDEAACLEICARIKEACEQQSMDLIKPSISLGNSTKDNMSQEIILVLKAAEDRMYQHKLLESQSNQSVIISSLEKTLFERSHETEEHAQRMREICHVLGEELGLSEKEQDDMSLFCLLHDIGKIAIADSILMKDDRLSMDEWETMKKHPEIGYRIAESSKKLSHISEYILTHHERWDGTGYPKGLKGTETPKLSRILSIVDAYDVMTNTRVYKTPMSQKEALKEINRCAGTQFDPHIAKVFIKMISSQNKKSFFLF